ncbi:hypothetical protein FACS1894206_06170 [Deltaproteobacteria bacterium]|nr:hypothetical protein FACS1894206_06170 [Deltaproteobacteria bacterium]
MDFLAGLGPVIHIDVPLPIILERIARKPDRGLIMNPGQTIQELYDERSMLYANAATMRFCGSEEPVDKLVGEILVWLRAPDGKGYAV